MVPIGSRPGGLKVTPLETGLFAQQLERLRRLANIGAREEEEQRNRNPREKHEADGGAGGERPAPGGKDRDPTR